MERENKSATGANNDPQNDWQNAEHQGDWQLAESDAEDTAEMLTSYQSETKNHLYAAGDEDPDDKNDKDQDEDSDEDEDDDEEEASRDWGHTDPLDSPFPDSNDPSGPGSAV